MQEVEILENKDDMEVSNMPLKERPKHAGAAHCRTARELDLYLFSSNYQTFKGGHCDLQMETGIEVGVGDGSDRSYLI